MSIVIYPRELIFKVRGILARCEICGRKIPFTQRFCGKKDCINKDDPLPRCVNCGQLIYDSNKDDKCPFKKQPHIIVTDTGPESTQNTTVTFKTKAEYNRKVV